MKVSWDDYSQHFPTYGKKNVPNHQPVIHFHPFSVDRQPKNLQNSSGIDPF
jgi:hypothetical protein